MTTSSENAEVTRLHQRIKQLETIEQEYLQFKELLDYAAKSKRLEKHAQSAILYAHPNTKQILDANSQALKFLGYPLEELTTFTLDDLEIESSQKEKVTYTESSIETQLYDCSVRHHDGNKLDVKIRKWLITKNNKPQLCYTIEDTSLQAQLWHELSRREDTDYQFQEKLKNLNEITIELGHLESFDDICKRGVELGIQKLGFDRLALFFLNPSKTLMVGTFGVDELGNIRDEREQSWEFKNSFIMGFVNGSREPVIKQDNAPLYNASSEVVGYGWHVSVPILDSGEFIGFMTTDNLINKEALQDFQPDLLSLFGATIGHLTARQLEQETIRKLSSAVQHSSSMIVVLNKQQVIEFANNAFCQKSGYSLPEILQQDAIMLFPPDLFQTIRKQISAGQSWRGELVNQTKTGSPYEAFVSISPVRLGDTIENFVIVQEDISMLKQAQHKEVALQLEQERARILGSFVTDVGHEFKTPLSIIHTSNFIRNQVQDKKKQAKHTERIQEQVEILSQMLNDILEIVTLTSTLELTTEKVRLDGFVNSIINNAKSTTQNKALNWHIHLDSHITLQADPGKLARVVYEVLKNALEFTPTHGTISIDLKRYEKEVGIIIQDSGIGIPADEIDRIFDRFYRVDKARTKRHAGLGLAVARLLIEAHQGEIKVESVLGKGSRFEILLPLK